jgi:hypothetical protein
VHGRLHFLAVSDQGEPPAELDSELFLVHDLLAATVGASKLDAAPASASASSRITWSSKRQHDGFLRLVDTSLALCAAHPSVLVRALEQIEVNDDIRATCAAKLKEVLADLPELRGAALFVGTRVLVQCGIGGAGASGGVAGGIGGAAAGAMSPQDVLTMMLHVHSIFRPAVRSTDTSKEKTPQSTPSASAAAPSPPPTTPSSSESPQSLSSSQQPSEGGGGPPVSANSTPVLQTPAAHQTTTRVSPMRSVPTTPTVAVMAASPGAFGTNSPRRGGGGAMLRASPAISSSAPKHGRRKSGAVPAPPPIIAEIPNVEGGLCGAWIPAELASSANVGVLYFSVGQGQAAHAVYSAELLPGIFLVVALRESAKRVADQRNILAYAHIALRDWLAQDYAPFLLTKERAHMPMLSYVAQVPGVVHFIFVDRLRHLAIVPSVAPLYGQDSSGSHHTHTTASLRRLVWRLVQHAHSHLARGCTTMMLRSDGFHFSYRLWLEGENEDPPALDRVVSPKLPQPWIVSPQLYSDLIAHYRATRCYELYSIYVGAVSITAIAKKDRQLLQAMAALTGQAFGF